MKNHQPETFVTQHDLQLLHKKIIATDLIVQKYQEANKALLRLQVENDDLKQRIEQMENECSIFGKQVTECTQESDHLKKQIEFINNEKTHLNQQIRALQDENTSNQHEIMVLRQFESLKDTNDQLTKNVERQQKMISKLQLQVQRKSPVVYKPNKNPQESSETEAALTKSQKSVLELKLALGRLVNFIELSKIEVPTSIHIRPVLKAHEINDNFLETEHVFVHKPVKKVSKPVNVDRGDTVDVNPAVPALLPVNQTATIETTRAPEKKSKKSRRKKAESTSENEKLDALASELEIALAKSDQEQPSQILSLFTEDETPESDKQQPEVHNTQSTISFFTDDDEDEEASRELIPPTSLLSTPMMEPSTATLQVDHITPMDVQISEKSANYMSTLSEDEEENPQTMSTEEYISPIEVIQTPLESSDKPSSSPDAMETEKDSLAEKENESVESTRTTDIMDPKHRETVFRLLKFLTQLPVPLKPVRLARRRMKPTVTLQEQLQLSTDDEGMETPAIETTQPVTSLEEISTVLEPPVIEVTQPSSSIVEPSSTADEVRKKQDDVELNEMETAEASEHLEQLPSAPENTGDTPQEDLTTIPAGDLQRNTNTSLSEMLLTPEEQQNDIVLNEGQAVVESEHPTIENNVTIDKVAQQDQRVHTEKDPQTTKTDATFKEARKEAQAPVVVQRPKKSVTIIAQPSTLPKPQEPTPRTKHIQAKPPLARRSPSLVKAKPSSTLTSFQISVLNRLLHTLTTLPITPLRLPNTYPPRKRQRKFAVAKPSTPSRPVRASRSPTRTLTRSLASIRAQIARCNQQPAAVQRKRTTTEVHTSPAPTTKRKKPNEFEHYELISKYLQSSAKEISQSLREFLEEKIETNLAALIDRLFSILADVLFKKCDAILKLVNQLHPYEESVQILLQYVTSKSARFQEDLIKKLNEQFQLEIKQSQMPIKRIEILNRLLIIICSISPSASSITIYARLFDIGYSLSYEMLVEILAFTSHIYPSFLTANAQTSSSNVLLHQILLDLAKDRTLPITSDYLQNLLLSYRRYTHDPEDLIRCFILIFRFRDWSWCSAEVFRKILSPLLNQTNDSSQRTLILMILQHLLFVYKINEDFQQDHRTHQEIKQQLKKLKATTAAERGVREKIFSMLSTCC